MQVFDERDGQRLRVVDVEDDTGNLVKRRLDGGAVTPFAGDDLEPRAALTHQQRLQHSDFLDRSDEFVDRLEKLPGLVRVRDQGIDRNLLTDSLGVTRCELFHEMMVMAHSGG